MMERLQTNISTIFMREMETLSVCKRTLPPHGNLNILSFGCSVGDELATLRLLFPHATISGCDVDSFALATANRLVGHLASVFESSESEIAKRGPYDLICAFASLCINPAPKPDVMRASFPYSRFVDILGLFNDALNPGGIMAIRNSSYPFSATALAKSYRRIRSVQNHSSGFIPMFNINGEPALQRYSKRGQGALEIVNVDGLDDWDLIDCVFQKGAATDHALPPISYDFRIPRPDVTEGPCMEWERSNLDPIEERTGHNLLELKQSVRVFGLTASPGRFLIETDILKRSICGSEYLSFPTRRMM